MPPCDGDETRARKYCFRRRISATLFWQFCRRVDGEEAFLLSGTLGVYVISRKVPGEFLTYDGAARFRWVPGVSFDAC